MKNFNYLLFVLGIILFSGMSSPVFSQKGIIKGTVIDAGSAETLIGVAVVIEGTSSGASTDLDGNYQISIAPGKYNIIASYVSYTKQRIEGVVVEAGKVVQIDIKLSEEAQTLSEVVVQATLINNNDVSMLKLQQKAAGVQDGISSTEMRLMGTNNSAESMKQVTGASMEGGKYVVMRGLGDRYSLTQLNGVTLPSTDPYRNSSNMDLIPSNMVENIVTTKTFTPDQPGNFAGGNVNITTKSLPDQLYVNFSTSLGFNTSASLKSNFLTDPIKGSKDWLGYDDGSRAMPSVLQSQANRDILSAQGIYVKVRQTDEQYDPQRAVFNSAAKELSSRSMLPGTKTSFLDTRYNFSMGNRKELSIGKLGYNMGLNYYKTYQNFNDAQLNIWEYSSDPNATVLSKNFNTRGQQSIENASIGAIGSVAYQINPTNELSFDVIYNHSTDIRANQYVGVWPAAFTSDFLFASRNISMVERGLTSMQLKGKSVLKWFRNAEVNGVAGYILSSQHEPDTRIFGNQFMVQGDTTFTELNRAEYDMPFHFFRTLNDRQLNFNGDITIPITSNPANKIKAGVLGSRKNREFDEYRFQLGNTGALPGSSYLSFEESMGNYSAFFSPDNFGTLGVDPNNSTRYVLGNYFLNQSKPSNFYTGHEAVFAAYAMGTYAINDKLKAVAGARLERTDFEVVSEAKDQNNNYVSGQIKKTDLLPSLNMTYAVNDKSNVRMAVSKTLARPNMREMAPFESFENLGGFIFQGNPTIKRSRILNYDLRYEFFPKSGEMVAVSAFYKSFKDPIVRVLEPTGAGGIIMMDNADKAMLTGLELEFRKNLGFINPMLDNFKLSTNFTYTYSRVNLTDREYEANKSVNPDAKSWRPFQAQSPFIFNVNVSYVDVPRRIEAAIFSNMFGRRQFFNGFAGSPDVYEIYGRSKHAIPTPDIGFTFSKGITEKLTLAFRGTNLLNYTLNRNVQFKGNYYTTEAFRPGTTISMSLRYSF